MSTINIEQLLKEGKPVQVSPQGTSMIPFIYPGRDEVIIVPINRELRQYDIILFRSKKTGLLTLHRIIRIIPRFWKVMFSSNDDNVLSNSLQKSVECAIFKT